MIRHAWWKEISDAKGVFPTNALESRPYFSFKFAEKKSLYRSLDMLNLGYLRTDGKRPHVAKIEFYQTDFLISSRKMI